MNALRNAQLSGLDCFLAQASITPKIRAQKQAIASLRKTGFPNQKVEMWKYTDLNWLNRLSFKAAFPVSSGTIKTWIEDHVLSHDNLAKLPRLVFANGFLNPSFSTALSHRELQISNDSMFLRSLTGPDQEVMTALNYAMGNDSIRIHLSKTFHAETLLIVHLGINEEEEYISFHPRYGFDLEAETKLSILEMNIGKGNYFRNPLYEITVGAKASFNYTRIVDEATQAFHGSVLYADLADHAHFNEFVLTLDTKWSRQETYLQLQGEWAEAQFHAIQNLKHQQHADLTTEISHMTPHGSSRQNIKNILSDQSHGVFQGKIFVNRLAQKTDAQQQNHALLLSDKAEINTKPELEIYADDVRCTHGATVGALDEEQMFFLMARGIPYQQARKILIEAFIAETLEFVSDPVALDVLKYRLGLQFSGEII